MPNIQVSFTIEPKKLERIDRLKMGIEKRASVLRRVIDAGLPIVERQQREMKKVEQ